MYRWMLIVFLATLNQAFATDKIEVVAEQYAPFAITDKAGHVSGIGVDVLDEITRQTGYEFDIHVYPLARIRAMMERGEVDVSVAESPMWFDAAKITSFTFSKPYVHVFESVYFPANKVFSVEKPLDLKGHRVGIHHGYYYAAFDKLFKDGTLIADEAESSELLIKKLLAGRSDVIFLDNFEFGYTVNTLKLSQDQFVKGMQLTDSPVSIMVHNRGKEILNRINPVIERMIADGTVNKIVNKYISAHK